jgi:hypothetical protein
LLGSGGRGTTTFGSSKSHQSDSKNNNAASPNNTTAYPTPPSARKGSETKKDRKGDKKEEVKNVVNLDYFSKHNFPLGSWERTISRENYDRSEKELKTIQELANHSHQYGPGFFGFFHFLVHNTKKKKIVIKQELKAHIIRSCWLGLTDSQREVWNEEEQAHYKKNNPDKNNEQNNDKSGNKGDKSDKVDKYDKKDEKSYPKSTTSSKSDLTSSAGKSFRDPKSNSDPHPKKDTSNSTVDHHKTHNDNKYDKKVDSKTDQHDGPKNDKPPSSFHHNGGYFGDNSDQDYNQNPSKQSNPPLTTHSSQSSRNNANNGTNSESRPQNNAYNDDNKTSTTSSSSNYNDYSSNQNNNPNYYHNNQNTNPNKSHNNPQSNHPNRSTSRPNNPSGYSSTPTHLTRPNPQHSNYNYPAHNNNNNNNSTHPNSQNDMNNAQNQSELDPLLFSPRTVNYFTKQQDHQTLLDRQVRDLTVILEEVTSDRNYWYDLCTQNQLELQALQSTNEDVSSRLKLVESNSQEVILLSEGLVSKLQSTQLQREKFSIELNQLKETMKQNERTIEQLSESVVELTKQKSTALENISILSSYQDELVQSIQTYRSLGSILTWALGFKIKPLIIMRGGAAVGGFPALPQSKSSDGNDLNSGKVSGFDVVGFECSMFNEKLGRHIVFRIIREEHNSVPPGYSAQNPPKSNPHDSQTNILQSSTSLLCPPFPDLPKLKQIDSKDSPTSATNPSQPIYPNQIPNVVTDLQSPSSKPTSLVDLMATPFPDIDWSLLTNSKAQFVCWNYQPISINLPADLQFSSKINPRNRITVSSSWLNFLMGYLMRLTNEKAPSFWDGDDISNYAEKSRQRQLEQLESYRKAAENQAKETIEKLQAQVEEYKALLEKATKKGSKRRIIEDGDEGSGGDGNGKHKRQKVNGKRGGNGEANVLIRSGEQFGEVYEGNAFRLGGNGNGNTNGNGNGGNNQRNQNNQNYSNFGKENGQNNKNNFQTFSKPTWDDIFGTVNISTPGASLAGFDSSQEGKNTYVPPSYWNDQGKHNRQNNRQNNQQNDQQINPRTHPNYPSNIPTTRPHQSFNNPIHHTNPITGQSPQTRTAQQAPPTHHQPHSHKSDYQRQSNPNHSSKNDPFPNTNAMQSNRKRYERDGSNNLSSIDSNLMEETYINDTRDTIDTIDTESLPGDNPRGHSRQVGDEKGDSGPNNRSYAPIVALSDSKLNISEQRVNHTGNAEQRFSHPVFSSVGNEKEQNLGQNNPSSTSNTPISPKYTDSQPNSAPISPTDSYD